MSKIELTRIVAGLTKRFCNLRNCYKRSPFLYKNLWNL